MKKHSLLAFSITFFISLFIFLAITFENIIYVYIAVIALSFICLILYIFYLITFHSRKHCLKKIGGSQFYINDLSEKILNKDIINFQTNEIFNNVFQLYKEFFNSCDIKYENRPKIDNAAKYPFKKYNIQYRDNPIAIRFAVNRKRGIVFYIFPKAILAFAESPMKTTFIGAYNLKLLNVSYSPTIYTFSEVIPERSKNNIEYYYKYSPVPDADIHYCDWTVKNSDGSRSFRGGLLPEHNPLNFELKYAKIQYDFGLLRSSVNYSNHKCAKEFTESYMNYSQQTK